MCSTILTLNLLHIVKKFGNQRGQFLLLQVYNWAFLICEAKLHAIFGFTELLKPLWNNVFFCVISLKTANDYLLDCIFQPVAMYAAVVDLMFCKNSSLN